MTDQDVQGEIVILTALYSDWPSFNELVARLDRVLSDSGLSARIVVVDDGSPAEADTGAAIDLRCDAIIDITHITLLRNMGNQGALAIGIGYVAREMACSYLVLMDSDLEDRPEHVPALIAEAKRLQRKVVFGARSQRSEGPIFKVFYSAYKAIYKLLTGHPISIGNFSVIPGSLVRRVASVSEILNHYPAGIMRARIPYSMVDAARGQRIYGKSKMNFVLLVIHGLSGLAVHADVVGVRSILAIILIALTAAIIMPIVIILRLFTDVFVLGWTSQMVTILAGILLQAFFAGIFIVFVVLTGKNQRQFIPMIDYGLFIMDTTVTPVRKPARTKRRTTSDL